MFGCDEDGKSNEQVIEEMEEQSQKTGRPVITDISEKVTIYDFSTREQEAGSRDAESSSEGGRIDDIEGRVDLYIDQGMDVTDAAKATYDDINSAYEGDAASINEVQSAVQELETYVEDKGGDLQAAAAALDAEVEDSLERIMGASGRIEEVYDDLVG